MSLGLPGCEPLVSIVTPVYNNGEYIQECVESVLRQTYANWEYVIVDNASDDETPDIVARFAARDSRIRHMRFDDHVDANENHNRAFRTVNAESEFCKVVQGDDWLYPRCIERMVGLGMTSDSIGIVSAYCLWGSEVSLVGIDPARSIVSGREILQQALLGRLYVTGGPSAVLYRTRLVLERESFFSDGFVHADTDAAYWILSRSDLGFVHETLTFARRQQGARMQSATALNTFTPENIRFLLRYGSGVLAPSEYRQQLRLELRNYVYFHLRQLPKASRLADRRFFSVHRAEIDRILGEANGDTEVARAMALVRLMLLRDGWRRRLEPALL